jgi:23S rRNA (pseudouridine1915-N3)-methyltransferase
MKFRFVWIGKTKSKDWRSLQEEYLSRLSHFIRCEIVEIKESSANEGKEIEGKRIISSLLPGSFTVLLDVEGLALSSHSLASQVEKWQNRGLKEINFLIGGQDGVSSEVVEKADFRLSLSGLTFTHEMARIVLLEQLYRAYTIINGFPYQK